MRCKKFVILAAIISILILISLLVFVGMDDYFYAKALVSAIKDGDCSRAAKIIKTCPDSINTFPSITPKGWRSAMNWRVVYPLTEACISDNVELVTLLIENGADVNCNDGLTPLSVTYQGKQNNWYKIAELLIQNGASLDYITEYSGGFSSVLVDIVQAKPGANAADYVPENAEDVMDAFLFAVQNCNHDNIRWMRVLQHSVTNDRHEIVAFLIDENYCDVNDISVGMTALMFAARDSDFDMVQLLLNKGADPDIVSEDGKTALDYAKRYGDDDVVGLLEGLAS